MNIIKLPHRTNLRKILRDRGCARKWCRVSRNLGFNLFWHHFYRLIYLKIIFREACSETKSDCDAWPFRDPTLVTGGNIDIPKKWLQGVLWPNGVGLCTNNDMIICLIDKKKKQWTWKVPFLRKILRWFIL